MDQTGCDGGHRAVITVPIVGIVFLRFSSTRAHIDCLTSINRTPFNGIRYHCLYYRHHRNRFFDWTWGDPGGELLALVIGIAAATGGVHFTLNGDGGKRPLGGAFRPVQETYIPIRPVELNEMFRELTARYKE